MKAELVSASIYPRANSGDTQLIHGVDKDQWLKNITVGQILKGRILREYSDNKYGVNFGGQERVVDSAIPLTKGDTLAGRVTSIKDNTVSMKLVNSADINEAKNASLEMASSESKTPIEIEAENFKIDLTQPQRNAIIKATNQIGNTIVAIRVGLYLAKLGLPITPDLVRLLSERVLDTQKLHFTDTDIKAPQLITSTEISRLQTLSTLESISKFYIEEFTKDQPEDQKDKLFDFGVELKDVLQFDKLNTNEKQQNPDEHQQLNHMLHKLLNVSSECVAQHRLQTLPIIIDGKLIEFDVAFFDQAERQNKTQVLESKRVKFALNTDFGLLNLDAKVVNNRLNISFASESEYFIDQLGGYASDLNASLIDAGWIVDQVEYKKVKDNTSAAFEIVNHVLQQNSLDIEL
ncbi:MAG: hypothetical protein ACMZ63_06310 [Methylotenera sp.]